MSMNHIQFQPGLSMPEFIQQYGAETQCEEALVVALSFCRLLGLGCPKQAFAKIATPRIFWSKISENLYVFD